MPSPFPGMDPWLEAPDVFPDLHDSFLFCLKEALNGSMPAPYFCRTSHRVWVEATRRYVEPDVDVLRPHAPGSNGGPGGPAGGAVAVAEAAEPVVVHVPLEEVREAFLEVRAGQHGERLVTVIELLSPTNKTTGEHGRDLYLKKQREVRGGQVHLVEIDLLRAGTHSTAVPQREALARTGGYDYHVCVTRFDRPEDYLVYPIRLNQPLPVITIPLLGDVADVPVNLQQLLDRSYDVGRYGTTVRYTSPPPPPPLSPEWTAWAESVLRTRGLLPPLTP